MYAYACVCIGQTSSSPSVRLRIQSLPGGAESHFFRWLTAVHNNNNCSAFIPLRDNLLYFSPPEDGKCKLIFIFEFFKSTVERMNEIFFTRYHSTVKIQGSSPRCVLWRSMVINTLGDDCLLRMRAIIPLLVK